MSKSYYITTTAPYVNSDPHLGFALEIVQADVLARYHSLIGDEVFFNTGTDEHGKKIYEKAIEQHKEPQNYVDEYAAKFDNLKKALNLTYNSFQRTTSKNHIKAAEKMWKLVLNNGFIEKGIYKAKYCVGCELEKQDTDLINGRCPLHPNKELETIEEENYFFKFSKLQEKLLKYYEDSPNFVFPTHRQKEISNFVTSGLNDFSISRLKEKMAWGIPVPGDEKQVMYVWFDALTYYISALGWPDNIEKFEKFWGTVDIPNAIQVAGKDNLRQQSAMWQAMLFAAGLPPTKQILIHGFITSNGQKMSKSLGNVVNPFEYIEKYGTDALRYYLLAKVSPTEDSDFTKDKFEESYNADLANGLGNLVSRVAKLAESTDGYIYKVKKDKSKLIYDVETELMKYQFDSAISLIWGAIKGTDEYLSRERPWKKELSDENQKLSKFVILSTAIDNILEISFCLQPFLPQTAEKIENIFKGPKIKASDPLFPRI